MSHRSLAVDLSQESSTKRSPRATLSLLVMAAGALLLAALPVLLLALALGGAQDVQLPGTLLIVSATLGMILVAVAAALRD